MTTQVLVLFGSNVEPKPNAVAAARELAAVLDEPLFSSAWRSDAVGSGRAPRFINWVASGRVDVGPAELKFDLLRPIEARLGRRRSDDSNAPREADLDILLFGDLAICDANAGIEIPDPDLAAQAYVLVPAAEVAPEMVVPGVGRSITELAAAASTDGLERLGPVLDLTSS